MDNQWSLELEKKPDFDQAMQRIYAWYEQEMIDWPSIRVSAHNTEYSAFSHLQKLGQIWKTAGLIRYTSVELIKLKRLYPSILD